ncbi:hypothetical protein [Saccharopolyspora griseoalba]|uniref:AAA family ATPase n=1 Tax=Saccharopolyspora griseoalba TaxID=1431848 RepID=A0ABW2LTX5_9PSEU
MRTDAYKASRYENGKIAIDGHSIELVGNTGRVFNGLVTGYPGTGKTMFLETLGMAALASGSWKVLYTYGVDGARPGFSNTPVRWGSGTEAAWQHLAAAKNHIEWSSAENATAGLRGLIPSPARQSLLWIIDELDRLCAVDPAFGAELTRITHAGGRNGMAVWASAMRASGGNFLSFVPSSNVVAL